MSHKPISIKTNSKIIAIPNVGKRIFEICFFGYMETDAQHRLRERIEANNWSLSSPVTSNTTTIFECTLKKDGTVTDATIEIAQRIVVEALE